MSEFSRGVARGFAYSVGRVLARAVGGVVAMLVVLVLVYFGLSHARELAPELTRWAEHIGR